MTHGDKWKKRPAVLRYRAFCDTLRLQAQGYEVPEQLGIRFHMPMPPSWSKKKRAAHMDQPHQSRPDIDNLVKSVLDALCEEDSYVHTIHAEKRWSDTGMIHLWEIA
jgi:Holliday junction resolvase RusA-like endonuclease